MTNPSEPSVQFRLDDGTDGNGVATRIWLNFVDINTNVWLQIANTNQDMIRAYQNHNGTDYNVIPETYGIRLTEGIYKAWIDDNVLYFQNVDGGTPINLSGTLSVTPPAGQVGFEVINGTTYIDDLSISDLSGGGGGGAKAANLDYNTIPTEFSLDSNYPNPFNPTTQIRFGLPEESHVQLIIYDITGREITTLIKQKMPAGYHVQMFNAHDIPSGIYFYRLTAGRFIQSKKMILIK